MVVGRNTFHIGYSPHTQINWLTNYYSLSDRPSLDFCFNTGEEKPRKEFNMNEGIQLIRVREKNSHWR